MLSRLPGPLAQGTAWLTCQVHAHRWGSAALWASWELGGMGSGFQLPRKPRVSL